MLPHRSRSPLFPYTTLFRSDRGAQVVRGAGLAEAGDVVELALDGHQRGAGDLRRIHALAGHVPQPASAWIRRRRSEEHTSELQSRPHLVCRLLLEKKKKKT